MADDTGMGRPLRTQAGGLVYHVLNRANARTELFGNAGDYEAFPMRILFYCIMPNHWHLVVWPEHDGTLSPFVGWLTLTHTQRRHAYRHSVGSGHVYQGRFKSFVVEADEHLLTLGRYSERNALRAGLVGRAEDWRWGSLWQRIHDETDKRPELTAAPLPLPRDWTDWVNAPQTAAEELAIRRCSRRGQPFGSAAWVESLVRTKNLLTSPFDLFGTRRTW